MKDILFNSHDVVLMLAIGLSLLLAAYTVCGSQFSRVQRSLLTAFLLLNACVSLDTLLFWGDSVKYVVFQISSILPMAFAFSSFVIGPVLYWFFRSILAPQKRIGVISCIHLIPALLTPFYLYWASFRHPLEYQADLILAHSIFSEPGIYFLFFLTLKKLVPVIYGAFCLRMLFQDWASQAKSETGLRRILHPYVGFPILWLWILTTHILGQWLPLPISDAMGIFSNYLSLTLILGLLFRVTVAVQVKVESNYPEVIAAAATEVKTDPIDPPKDSDNESELSILSERIARFVEDEKPYLNSQLTLNRFAELLQLSPRQVSTAINSCFRQNFNEYINRFRVDEAKQLLHSPAYQNLTVMEIAQRAGFSSKATFNRLFKSLMGTPPNVYRQQALADVAHTSAAKG